METSYIIIAILVLVIAYLLLNKKEDMSVGLSPVRHNTHY